LPRFATGKYADAAPCGPEFRYGNARPIGAKERQLFSLGHFVLDDDR
jgi:hypothetical protein